MSWGRCYNGGLVKANKLFVLTGPSGVGKSTLIRRVLDEKPGEIIHPITYTTRALRPGEVQGRDISSIPCSDWTPRLGHYLATTIYQGEMYGTLRQDVLDVLMEGNRAIVAFDEAGVDCVRDANLPAVFVYLVPTNTAQLTEWLLKRWPDGGLEFERRLADGVKDFHRFEIDPSFRNKFDYWIISDDMDQMTEDMLEIMGFALESV